MGNHSQKTRKARRGDLDRLGKFMPLPVEVAKQASRRLTAPEFRVFVCIAAQSLTWSNGTAMLVRSVIREWKLGSYRTVTSAIKKLLDAGLIVRTREARQHKAALYGVRYLSLNWDALAKQDVYRAGDGPDGASSATNSGSAAALPHGNRQPYRAGSAEPKKDEIGAPALPRRKRKQGLSTNPALPQGYPSKNLPGGSGKTVASTCAVPARLVSAKAE